MSDEAITMDFPNALRAVINGRRITKLEWDNLDSFGMLRNGNLMIYRSEKAEWFNWIINDGDLLGKDWVVLP